MRDADRAPARRRSMRTRRRASRDPSAAARDGARPRTTARERAARPGHRVVLRRDRHRARRGRPADPRQRRRVPGRPPRPDRRDRARGRRAGPPALDRPGPRRGVGRRRRRRGTTSMRVAVTYGPGLAGSLLVGHQLRQGARLGPRQAARRRQPPRGPRLRGLAARPGEDEASRASRSSRSSRSSSPAATRSSPRCATT